MNYREELENHKKQVAHKKSHTFTDRKTMRHLPQRALDFEAGADLFLGSLAELMQFADECSKAPYSDIDLESLSVWVGVRSEAVLTKIKARLGLEE